jgi:tRNA (mo5U34)-methyltransferase
MTPPPARSPDAAQSFIEGTDFVWHQRFELAEGVYAPGAHDLDYLFEAAEVPLDLTRKSVLDIGTANGGAAFVCERRGAAPVVAIDIYPPDWFGFDAIRAFLGSSVEYVTGNVYALGSLLSREFDLILFWGVLYHLRHPLLALDAVRAAVADGGEISIETAVSDDALGDVAGAPVARFYRGPELGGDSSNWFAPSTTCLVDWCESSGLRVKRTHVWGEGDMKRAMVAVETTVGDPEYLSASYEVPLTASPADHDVRSWRG